MFSLTCNMWNFVHAKDYPLKYKLDKTMRRSKYLFIYLFIYLLVYLFIYLFIHFYIYIFFLLILETWL